MTLTDELINDIVDSTILKMRRRGPCGQQLTTHDSFNHQFARAIESALTSGVRDSALVADLLEWIGEACYSVENGIRSPSLNAEGIRLQARLRAFPAPSGAAGDCAVCGAGGNVNDGAIMMYLYQHSDGRAVVAPAGHKMFNGDPRWARQFPVEVFGEPVAEVVGRQLLENESPADTPRIVALVDDLPAGTKLYSHPVTRSEPAAWIDPSTGDVISNDRRQAWATNYGIGGARKAATYTRPLYAATGDRNG